MGKFGKKVNIVTDLSRYIIGVMGQSGFGKSTLMYNVCEKEFGSDGYIVLDMGTEDGTAALQGVVAEQVPTWTKMKEIVDDIVKNKATDYPDLKVIVIDTMDEAFNIAEQYCIAKWNHDNLNKSGFTKATSINSVEGGFGKGLDAVIDLVKFEISRLKKVGVGVFWTAHVKEKDNTDLFTGETYTTLTANMMQRYFNAIKNSTHIIGFGYFDRSIEKKEVGEENPVTKKKKERKIVTDESRKIKFRDDAMVADGKSRFADIVEEIPLDAEAFIKAIKDAIESEKKKVKVETPKANAGKVEKPVEDTPEATEEVDDKPPFDVDGPEDQPQEQTNEEMVGSIRTLFPTATKETKMEIKGLLKENGCDLDNAPVDVLNKIVGLLASDGEIED